MKSGLENSLQVGGYEGTGNRAGLWDVKKPICFVCLRLTWWLLKANSHFFVSNNIIVPRKSEYNTIIFLYPLSRLTMFTSFIPERQAETIHKVLLYAPQKQIGVGGSHSDFIWRKCLFLSVLILSLSLARSLSLITNTPKQTTPKLWGIKIPFYWSGV